MCVCVCVCVCVCLCMCINDGKFHLEGKHSKFFTVYSISVCINCVFVCVHMCRCVAEFEGNNIKNPLSLTASGAGEPADMAAHLTADKACFALIRMVSMLLQLLTSPSLCISFPHFLVLL